MHLINVDQVRIDQMGQWANGSWLTGSWSNGRVVKWELVKWELIKRELVKWYQITGTRAVMAQRSLNMASGAPKTLGPGILAASSTNMALPSAASGKDSHATVVAKYLAKITTFFL